MMFFHILAIAIASLVLAILVSAGYALICITLHHRTQRVSKLSRYLFSVFLITFGFSFVNLGYSTGLEMGYQNVIGVWISLLILAIVHELPFSDNQRQPIIKSVKSGKNKNSNAVSFNISKKQLQKKN